jgi:hypothetical protein
MSLSQEYCSMSAVRTAKYSKNEHAQRGRALYENQIRPIVESKHKGKIVALDIDTGIYEISDNTLTAADRLLARLPNAQIWFERVGQRGDYHFGSVAKGPKG